MRLIKKYLKKFTLIDLIIIAILAFGIIWFARKFYRKADYVDATVKVNDTSVTYTTWASETGTIDWFSQLFHPGMKEKDALGNDQATVLDVISYDTRPARRSIYLKMKLKVTYSGVNKQYSYNGKLLLIGSLIEMHLDDLEVQGLVTDVAGTTDKRQIAKLNIKAVIDSEDRTYFDTNGVKPYIADAIKVGQQIKDSRGNIILEILNKTVSDADRLTTTADGRIQVQKNPLTKKVNLEIRAYAYKINDKYYIFDDVPVLVGEAVPINTPLVSVYPHIISFSEE